MFHYFNTVTDDKGNSLPRFQVEVVQLADGQTVVPIFSDENGTPIQTVSGVANRAVADAAGNYDFFVNEGTYSLRFYDAKGGFLKSQRFLPLYGADQVTNVLSNAPVIGQLLGTDQIPIIRGGIVDVISADDFADFFNFGPPVFETSPSISGEAEVGQVLTANDGIVSGGSITGRNWLKDGGVLVGETNSTYTIIADDEGAEISVQVLASGPFGDSSETSAAVGPISSAILEPSASWDGTAGSGFASTPTDPARTTAKPIAVPLFVPRQVVTDTIKIGVGGASNNGGTLFDDLGIDYVDFMFEGETVRVSSPSLEEFTRPDGSTYKLFGWWVVLKKPSGTEGTAELYYEAVPKDTSMQNRVAGPFDFGLFDTAHDLELTVAASGVGADHTSIGDAFNAIASANATRPKITVIESGDYSIAGGSLPTHTCDFRCKIEATVPVTFTEPPPVSPFDFTRIRPRVNPLHFTGSNVTHDFVETLQFDPLTVGQAPWYSNGAKIRQSRGRDDLWRKIPRNIIPALFAGAAGSTVYLTEADIQDVNDPGDKAALVRGCVVTDTWADLFQGAQVVVGNKVTNHSSAFYYTNVEALSVQYTGSAATATLSRTGGNVICKEDGAAVLTFAVPNTEAAYLADTNYRVASVVDAINALPDWTATLLDDSRAAAYISFPGTTNGAGFNNLDVKTTAQSFPTHFDIHSDFWQIPNSYFGENFYVAQNECWDCDQQNTLIPENVAGNAKDFAVIANVWHNRTGVPDEALQAGTGSGSHMLYVANTLATQRLTITNTSTSTGVGDAYCLTSNNVSVRLTAPPAGAPLPTVDNNHVHNNVGLASTAVGTSIGGDGDTLFVDAANGDFTPAGLLLDNLVSPAIPFDYNGNEFSSLDAKGATSI